MASQLNNAYIIGEDNFKAWSQGFDTSGYLKVLPHPDQKVAFKDPYKDWQEDKPGNYFSSWGPEKELNATLRMENIPQIEIEGLGILKSGDGLIPWFNNEKTSFEQLMGYNGTIPGPMLITEPGDELKLNLKNNLQDSKQVSNLHTHGLHVSPMGFGDNVLTSIKPGESTPVNIKIPDSHFVGPDWYHPHLHGLTNEQVSLGLAGQLILAPPQALPDINKWNPKERPMYFMALNSFGIQQTNRVGKAGDPLNQNTSIALPAGTPLQVGDENGKPVYELSDAVYMGYNAKPALYDPQFPLGAPTPPTAPPKFEYGGGPLAAPVENIIHTVNGQYNPTIETTTGQWELFSFTNMNANAFHVIQLVKDDGEKLTPQTVTLVALDGDASGVVASNRSEANELPILSPGARISVQNWFEEPGTYYFLSNGTEEIMGDNAPSIIKGKKGFEDGHLIWGSQVLATVEVKGNPVAQGPFPEVYDSLIEQAQKIDELIAKAGNGEFDRQRTMTWSANLGGAIVRNGPPKDTEVETFEGTYGINGAFFGTDFNESQVPIAMPMLDSTEVWTIKNTSGQIDPNLPVNVPLAEWHPFHIHQNDFTVLEINGIPTKDLKSAYLEGVLSDTIALPPAYDTANPPTPENPYGTPANPTTKDSKPSEVKVLMKFEDFPGSYVNHCHILFHEDAGMMQALRVILNTKDTWLGLGSDESGPKGEIELFRANNAEESIRFTPYGNSFKGDIKLAIGDVNHKEQTLANENVTDNVTDVITVQSGLEGGQGQFTVKVFNGKTLIAQQEQGAKKIDGQDNALLLNEFTPFQQISLSANAKASVATGDIDGDGHSDIIVGAGGQKNPAIEVYSGKDYQLLYRVSAFHHEAEFTGTINLASGDVDGDNFDDIIVGQGSGGRGLVEVYSGKLIQSKGSLDGKQTSHDTAMLSEDFQPYGASYQGEVKVTSGYVLQRPDTPNGEKVQTYHANITTMAVGDVPDGHEAIKINTFLGGAHHGTEEASTHSSEASHSSETAQKKAEIRVDKEFTPDRPIADLAGTFANIPGLSEGESILFAQNASGKSEFIRLQEQNIAQTIDIDSGIRLQTKGDDVIYGDTGNNTLTGDLGEDEIYGVTSDDEIYGNQGNDTVGGGDGQDTVRGGKNNDMVFGNQKLDVLSGEMGDDTLHGGKDNDLIFGNEGQDELYGEMGNDSVWGGKDNDRLFGNQGQDLLSGDLGSDSLWGGKDADSLFGGSGDDWLSGDMGNDVLVGQEGRDRFILQSGTGTETILDFEKGQDLIGLAGGLTFADLKISDSNGATAIAITTTGEVLASLSNVQANSIVAEDFFGV